jgi:hypothetical protein
LTFGVAVSTDALRAELHGTTRCRRSSTISPWRSAMIPQRHDLSVPANQAKLDAADALGALADEAGWDNPVLTPAAQRRPA